MKKLLIITLSILFTGTLVQTALAVWNDPTSIAPNGNIAPPINTSATAQIKSGGVSVNSLIVGGGAKLGDTTTECNATTTGTMRFNAGLLQICSNTAQLYPGGAASSTDPLTPPSCLDGQVSVYDGSKWECNPVPQTLPVCGEGDILSYATSTELWECKVFIGAKFIDANNTENAKYLLGNVGIGATDAKAKLHVATTNDVTLTSTNHAATFGDHGGLNIAIDNNEIMARNNGATSDLTFQNDGGRLTVHNTADVTSRVFFAEDGRVIVGGGYDTDTTGKLIIDNTTETGPAGWYTSIKFTNNSHNAIWNPAGGMYFGLNNNGVFYWGDESGGTHEKYAMTLSSDNGTLDITTGSLDNAGNLSLNLGYIYMGTGNQLLLADGSTAFYSDSNGAGSKMRFYDKQGTRYGYIYGSGDSFGLLDGDGNWSIRNFTDSYTMFYINNSAKMTIENSGAVGIGTTAPNDAYLLDVLDDTTGYMTRFLNTSGVAGADLIRIRLNVATPAASANWMRFDSGGTARGYIQGYGNSLQYVISSDRRLKKNIKGIKKEDTLDLVLESRPVSFDWKENGNSDLGYIAQELQQIVPNAVTGNEDEFEIVHDAENNLVKIPKYMNVSIDTMIPVLHAGLRENILENQRLEKRVGSIKTESIRNKLQGQQEQIDFLLSKVNK